MSKDLIPVDEQQVVHVIATTPAQMAESQNRLILWCDSKINVLKQEVSDLTRTIDKFLEQRWNKSAIEYHLNKSRKELTYYEKVRSALQAGYHIVPNFPISAFAIRTTKRRPQGEQKIRNSSWDQPSYDQSAQILPEGKGAYQNPIPIVSRYPVKDGEGKDKWAFVPYENWNVIEFPISMAKLPIVEATSDAMALKIFDDFGILPASQPKGDPMIIGRIYNHTKRPLSFVIAWYINTDMI